MTVLGIWACRWRELKPISIGVGASQQQQQQAGPSSRPHAETGNEADDDTQGFFMSRGRGRGRNMPDGGGEFEMVRMKEMGEQAV